MHGRNGQWGGSSGAARSSRLEQQGPGQPHRRLAFRPREGHGIRLRSARVDQRRRYWNRYGTGAATRAEGDG